LAEHVRQFGFFWVDHLFSFLQLPSLSQFRNPNPGAELRLIDFGSGTMDVVSASTDIHTTMAGSGFYISPEVFQRSYTNKTDVWSSGVTLYVLVAGYPADDLQKAFNVLHKSKRNLRDLPQMPEQMPDSFIDLLDALLAYNPKTRKSAGDMLNCEFLNFYKTLQTNGLSLEDIAAEAAEAVTPLPEDSITRRIRRTKSVNLSGSVQRHSMFLDYQRFERSVTTLLATLLTKAEFDSLLAKLTARNEPAAVEEQVEVEADSTKIVVTNSQKLKVIPINELKDILTEMKQDRVYVSRIMYSLPLSQSFVQNLPC
jgi:serine/threonine protein kinase